MGWHLCKSFAWEDQEWQQNVPRRDKKFDLFLNAAIKLIPKVCKSCHLSRALLTGFVAWIEAIKSELEIILKSNHFWNIFSSTFHSNQLIIIFLSPPGLNFPSLSQFPYWNPFSPLLLVISFLFLIEEEALRDFEANWFSIILIEKLVYGRWAGKETFSRHFHATQI